MTTPHIPLTDTRLPTERPARRASLWALVGAVAVFCAGCGSPTPTRLYTLLPSEPAAASAPTDAQTIWVSLPAVGLPQQVDQPEWLVRAPDDTLRLLEQDRWAAPLRAELRAALMDGLVRRYGVFDAQQGVPVDRGGNDAVWRVVVDVTRFESLPGREARLEAAWSISAQASGTAPATALSCRSGSRSPVGASMASLADAHRANVQQLADQIGSALRQLHQQQPAACP